MNPPTLAERPLPGFVRDLISSPPRRGEGLNLWLFRTARVLHPWRAPSVILDLLRAATAGLPIHPGEIERAVENSRAHAWQPGVSIPVARPSAWPKLNREQREAVAAAGWGVADLWEASPVRWDYDAAHTEEIIDRLFPGNPLLCAGASKYDFTTAPRELWRGALAGLPFIVPSPMSAARGRTKGGRESAHTLENTGPRRFLVIEQDPRLADDATDDEKQRAADEQAAVLLHLAGRAPLALAVSSGGKSVHGWFYCTGQPEARLRAFFAYAVSLGADPQLWTPCQFVRMPDGTRENGKRQTVLYFNPEVLPS